MSGIMQMLVGAVVNATDAFFEYVTLLLPGDGTNGAQNNTFLDGSTNNFTITRNGNTTQGTFSPFSQTGWSWYFDGTGDYLTVADNAALDMGSSDFTIEGWVFPAVSSGGSVGIFSKRANGSTTAGVLLYYNLAGLTPTLLVESGGSWVVNQASSIAFTANQWNHFAVVRNGSSFVLYINGTSGATGTSAGAVTDNASAFAIGAWAADGSGAISASYISNFRVVKGTAVYTSNFTPPTAPLTAITNTSLLTCQSNRFIDNSTNNFAITRNGDVSVQAFSPFNPTASWSAATNGGSGYFDGSGDNLTVPDNAAFTFGTGDFTIETWIYTASSARQSITWNGSNGGITSTGTFYLELTAANKFSAYLVSSLGTAYTATSTASVSQNAWVHLAFVRNGDTVTTYINGTADGTANVTGVTANDSSETVKIGDYTTAGGGLPFAGYISNFRIVKGTAVYTANFTPPTTPLTAITNTSLLLNFTNAGILDATAKNDLETVGNAQISTTQSKWGGSSMYFDGTGDWLYAPAGQNWEFGSGDFTVEMWLNPSSTTTTDALISKGNASSTGNEVWTLQWGSGNKLEFYSGGGLGTPIVISTTAFSTGTWYHVAITRASGTTRIFVDGALEASSTTSYTVTVGGALYVGAGWYAPSSRDTSGYIDDLRITKGVARYTAAFTPPTTAFPLY